MSHAIVCMYMCVMTARELEGERKLHASSAKTMLTIVIVFLRCHKRNVWYMMLI